MRVVFMGTPDFAVPSLQILLDHGYEVCAVYTQPDKPKGRGHKLQPPPVKELALQHQIPVFQPATLRKEEVQAEIRSWNPDVIVVVAYGKLLPKAVLPAATVSGRCTHSVDCAQRGQSGRRYHHVYGRGHGYGGHASEGGDAGGRGRGQPFRGLYPR